MIADRLIKTRNETWEDQDEEGRHLHRTLGIAHLGGATLDNEENYLMKKFYTAMGAIQVERTTMPTPTSPRQAPHSSAVPRRPGP